MTSDYVLEVHGKSIGLSLQYAVTVALHHAMHNQLMLFQYESEGDCVRVGMTQLQYAEIASRITLKQIGRRVRPHHPAQCRWLSRFQPSNV